MRLLLLLTLLSLTLLTTAHPDPTCATGLLAGLACCPSACNRCGGKNCGVRSETLRTDCCPTSILTGARICSHRSPPCKLVLTDPTPNKAKCPAYKTRVFVGAGAKPKHVRKLVRKFKKIVRKRGGVRVIDWEGRAPFVLPEGYYDDLGVVFESKGNYNAVSNARDTKDNKFSSYLPEMITDNFTTYSGKRLFSPVMHNAVTVEFVKRGAAARARAFGAVFVDVGKKAVMKVFDKDGCLIERVDVPTSPGGLSFAGVLTKGIGRVELELGTVSISGFARKFRKVAVGDVVVLDDLVFGKPY